jgi:hypothetical protein
MLAYILKQRRIAVAACNVLTCELMQRGGFNRLTVSVISSLCLCSQRDVYVKRTPNEIRIFLTKWFLPENYKSLDAEGQTVLCYAQLN